MKRPLHIQTTTIGGTAHSKPMTTIEVRASAARDGSTGSASTASPLNAATKALMADGGCIRRMRGLHGRAASVVHVCWPRGADVHSIPLFAAEVEPYLRPDGALIVVGIDVVSLTILQHYLRSLTLVERLFAFQCETLGAVLCGPQMPPLNTIAQWDRYAPVDPRDVRPMYALVAEIVRRRRGDYLDLTTYGESLLIDDSRDGSPRLIRRCTHEEADRAVAQ